MADDILLSIITICLAVEKTAGETYTRLSSSAKHDDLKRFWLNMAKDEHDHVEFWEKLLDLANKDILHQVFDRAGDVREEVTSIEQKLNLIINRYDANPSSANAFLLAFGIELCMLHPAFETLFELMKSITGDKTPEDTYETHLRNFIAGVNKHGMSTPEFDLLSDALLSIWKGNRQLASQRHIDALTGVLNRRGFFSSVAPLAHLAQRNGNTVGIMVLDIDYFKMINDIYGRQTGDRVITLIATTLTANLRRSDVIGRYGGDEFIIYLSPVDTNFLFDIADKVRSNVEIESQKILPVTLSIGVAHCILRQDIDHDLDLLIKKADECLYQAKYTGKNKVVIGTLQP